MQDKDRLMIEHLQTKDAELTNRLGGLCRTRMTSKNRQAFMDSLLGLNQDLERCYHNLRECDVGSGTEQRYVERISVLEEVRFELLQKISGQAIRDYNTLPLSFS